MTNFEGRQPMSARRLPFLLLLLLLGGCATYKPMRLAVELQGSDTHAALLEVHHTLLAADFFEEGIPADVSSRVDRWYYHGESRAVNASIRALRQENRLVVLLHQTDGQGSASPLVKEVFWQVHEAVQEIFGPENVQIVEIHRSLR